MKTPTQTVPFPTLACVGLACLLAASAPAQRLPTTAAPPIPESEAEAPLAAARASLAAGRKDEAALHVRAALELRPHDLTILKEALSAAGDDEDAKLLWSLAWFDAAADAEGRANPDPAVTKLLTSAKLPAQIPALRAAAAKELARFAKAEFDAGRKAAGARLGAKRTALLLAEIASASPAVFAAAAKDVDLLLESYTADPKPVLTALEAVVAEGANTSDPALALRAALVLVAFGRQAVYPDLRGPKPPDVSGAAATGRRAVDRIRAEKAKASAPLTVDELRAMSAEERGAFTLERASWTNPGVAVSPEGRYRIETVCGFGTLLGVAETVESHHARLVAWFGVDPFKDRQGIVRIVPEHGALEGEGSPFWWAGGFQGGDVTTVVFAVGDIEGLGHTIVHELTHRFDGALHPFLPAWGSEGRGVWTAAAYASSLDEKFTENHASFGTIESAFIKGYGSAENLTKLLEGTVKDYRDNYPAGYALFTYLKTWEENGKKLFQPKLAGYLKGGLKGRNRPKDWFTACFVDDKDGRPAKFEDFAAGFGVFLKGFYWQSPAPWTSRYTRKAGKGRASGWVYDLPTWVRVRSRAEPWFGQDQARRAGDVLYDAGKKKEALVAYGWATEVDEWDPALALRFAELCDESGLKSLAYAARAENPRLFGALKPSAGPAPFLGALPKTLAFLKGLRDAAAEATEKGAPLAAAALAADHDRTADLLGVARADVVAPRESFGRAAHPGDPPARPLGAFGFVEDGLTDFEERRVKDLWFAAENGDLHVGRVKPRDGTGVLDRALWQRHAFARTKEWIPSGRYVIDGRVLFTTSYFSGAVVLGYRRADRVVRFGFSGGDFLYSAGIKKEAAKLESIGWHLTGRRPRDGGLYGSAPGGTHRFKAERGFFGFTLLVDGPEAHAFIDDVWVGSYADPEGLAIEGHVGFASDQGAVQIQAPRIRRLDRGRRSGLRLYREDGFDLGRDGTLVEDGLMNRRVTGINPGPEGAVVVFAPAAEKAPETPEEDIFEFDGLLEIARALPAMIKSEAFHLRYVVALPASLLPERRAKFRETLLERGGGPEIEIVFHERKTALRTHGVADRPAGPTPTVFLIDREGYYRAHADFLGYPDRLPEPLRHWARALRGRG